jgi:hypothetical protein
MGEKGWLKLGDSFEHNKLSVGLIENRQEWHRDASCPGIHECTKSGSTTSLEQHVVTCPLRFVTAQSFVYEGHCIQYVKGSHVTI